MPSKIKGFNEKGEGKWFEDKKLPEGWSYDDPNLKKESAPEPVKKKSKPKAEEPDSGASEK